MAAISINIKFPDHMGSAKISIEKETVNDNILQIASDVLSGLQRVQEIIDNQKNIQNKAGDVAIGNHTTGDPVQKSTPTVSESYPARFF